jgi:hypothetical protein
MRTVLEADTGTADSVRTTALAVKIAATPERRVGAVTAARLARSLERRVVGGRGHPGGVLPGISRGPHLSGQSQPPAQGCVVSQPFQGASESGRVVRIDQQTGVPQYLARG